MNQVSEKKPSGQITERKPDPVASISVLRTELEQMTSQFQAALPEHIPVARFKRVVMTALQNNPDLAKCSKSSLWNSCMRAAQDGLLPDGREGAIVPYQNQAQWLPMVFGIRKKVRNSNEISTWEVHAVYEKDNFAYELGDQPFIRHKPYCDKGSPGDLVAAYSVVVMKDGSISREVMSAWEIDQVRHSSRGQKTPWNVPEFYPEMCKKTVAKRHAKVLPMSSDLDDLLRRDDELYAMKDGSNEVKKPKRPEIDDFMTSRPEIEGEAQETKDSAGSQSSQGAAEGKAGASSISDAPADPAGSTEKGKEGDPPKEATEGAQDGKSPSTEPETDEEAEFGPPEAMEQGRELRRKNLPCRIPEDWVAAKRTDLIEAFKEGYDAEDAEIKAKGKKKS